MTWVIFLLSKLAALIVVLIAASFLVFSLLYLAPGSPLSFLLGSRSATPAEIASINKAYHLDAPFLVRYGDWLAGILRGDFGRSLVYRQDVSALLASRIGTTAELIGYSILVIALAGVALGTISALRKGVAEAVITALTTLFLSTPVFVVGVIFISALSVRLGWFPTFGNGSGFLDTLWHLTLPAIALSLSSAAFLARVTHTAVAAELRREHVETARSRGLAEWPIVRHHVLRNAMIPITTVLGLTVAGLVAGAVVVENVFALNGLGSLLVDAILQHDFAVVQAVVLILVGVFVLSNATVDVLYTVIDPRLKLGATS